MRAWLHRSKSIGGSLIGHYIAQSVRRAYGIAKRSEETLTGSNGEGEHYAKNTRNILMVLLNFKVPAPPPRFKLDKAKSIEAIDYCANLWPGVTQYFICKAMYFADKEHFLDWGRPISGDFYVAMEHGPVPSRIYELMKPNSGEEDDWLTQFDELLSTEQAGKLTHIYSRKSTQHERLSRTDREYLRNWIEHFHTLPPAERFKEIEHLAHKEKSWIEAREKGGNAPEMDLSVWGEAIGLDEKQFRQVVADVRRLATV